MDVDTLFVREISILSQRNGSARLQFPLDRGGYAYITLSHYDIFLLMKSLYYDVLPRDLRDDFRDFVIAREVVYPT